MILADRKKEKVELKGKKVELLTELSVIIEELRNHMEDDDIMFAVRLGMADNDPIKMLDLAKEMLEKYKEERNNENTKEDNI